MKTIVLSCINKLSNCILSALPGSDMGLGKHLVIYQAADEAKNKEKCVFTITVVQFKQEHPGRKYVVLSNLIAGKNVSCVPLFIHP